MNYIEEYYKAIQTKKINTSQRVQRQYQKLFDDLKNPSEYHYDEKLAMRPIEFIERFCKHSKGEWAGKAVKLELFQKAFINALFGFVDAQNKRRYREAFFYVARKNGKSTLLACIALYCLIADGESGAEIYSVATKKDQAALIFNEAVNMVKQSADLRMNVKKRKSDLYFGLTFSVMKPLGKNSDTLDGLNSSLVIVDELHSIQDRNLYEVMKQSQSARRQPLLITITTAGTLRESIFDDIYKYAIGVADNTIDDKSFLPIIYELDDKEEWIKKDCWQKANPALGSIKKIDDLNAKVKRAIQSPRDLTGVLVKDFNVIENRSTAWLTFDDLNNTATFDLNTFKGSYAIGGADLSITTDLTCATILLMDQSENRFVSQMYWLPADNFDIRVKREKIPYDKWLEEGKLRLCAGNTINYSDVTAWFIEIVEVYEITPAWVYYDSYSARYWIEEMQAAGFNMIRCIQGAKTLSLPMQMLGADLKAKKINYNNNSLLKWCISNTGIKEDRNGNIVPIKSQNPKFRIDGLASLLDAYVGLYEHYNEYKNTIIR